HQRHRVDTARSPGPRTDSENETAFDHRGAADDVRRPLGSGGAAPLCSDGGGCCCVVGQDLAGGVGCDGEPWLWLADWFEPGAVYQSAREYVRTGDELFRGLASELAELHRLDERE